jgi:DNA repair exonuclease SbcCD ATPase subunit
MARFFTPLVILVFLLSAVSLGLGIMLFQQREELKGRVMKLEHGHQSIAHALSYAGLQSNALQDYRAMDAQLRGLHQAARNTVDLQQTTSNQLVETRGELADAEATLSTTRDELAATKENVVQLEDSVSDRDAEIASKSRLIQDLESLRDQLSVQVDGMRNDLEVTQADLRDRLGEIASWREDYEKLVEECTQASEEAVDMLDVDFFGRILTVAPDWNLVIIQGGADRQLKPNVDLLVHRAQEVLGKVRVQSVEATMSVGEVVTRWSDQAISVGDQVISPERPKTGSST